MWCQWVYESAGWNVSLLPEKPEARNDRNPHIIHCASHCCVIMWSTQMILTWVFCGHIWLTSHRVLIRVAHWYTHILWKQLEWLYLDSGCWSIYTHSWLMNKEIHCRKAIMTEADCQISWLKIEMNPITSLHMTSKMKQKPCNGVVLDNCYSQQTIYI